MSHVFADSLFWIAIANPLDSWAGPAREAHQALRQGTRILTTEEVLCEFLTALADHPHLRAAAVRMLEVLRANPLVEVTHQSHQSFEHGLTLYRQRSDKQYSLVDCISMHTMRSRKIKRALTYDHHFEQEGFEVLITRS